MFTSTPRQQNRVEGRRRSRAVVGEQANVLLGNLAAFNINRGQKKELTLPFQPGPIGMRADWSTGLVTEVVEGGQAHLAGVTNAMIITQVNGMSYSERALDTCRSQAASYSLTFAEPRGQNGHGHHEPTRTHPERGSYSPVSSDATGAQQQGPLPAGSGIKLLACIGLDMCGNASFLLPELGEASDLAWAPIQALALRAMFDSNTLPLVGLVEELLPGTDLIPTATIGWCLEANGYFDRRLSTPQPPA